MKKTKPRDSRTADKEQIASSGVLAGGFRKEREVKKPKPRDSRTADKEQIASSGVLAGPNAPRLHAQVCEWILTEIGAGMSLLGTYEGRVWNAAHERCKQIVLNYRNGDGLFQMTYKAGKDAAEVNLPDQGNSGISKDSE